LAAVGASFVLIGAGWGSSALALECPRTHRLAGLGTIRETRDDIAAISSTLSRRSRGGIEFEVANLRHRHPGANNGEIVNYIMTAYCPVINSDAGKSERQKRTDLRKFSRQLASVVYR
jgi:hypothetical protein